MNPATTLAMIFTVIALIAGYKIWTRLQLSRAKHPSLSGHARWSRRFARLVPYFEYDESRFYNCDGAPSEIISRRKMAFARLSSRLREQAPNSIAFGKELETSIADLQFTSAYRIPFPFRSMVRKHLPLGGVITETEGVKAKDLDDNWRFDLTGAYGVNVFGYDFYKQCMQRAWEKVGSHVGPVLGPLHPVVADNVKRLKAISGLDEVSFHMSGTEAVMQAVRMARYHTGKSHLVMLCGAYHGWWDGVQPGVGGQRKTRDVYMLRDMHEATLTVLETRNDIACVLINPLQAMHPNSGASGDGSLVASDRKADFNKQAYGDWLKRIREVCSKRGIVLIFDEVFTGFRLASGGAQAYFGIQADLVTYGKTLGGGLPIGVVCGSHALMKRFRDDRPLDITFARGTFNSHPFVMAAMNEFLRHIDMPSVQKEYEELESTWDHRASLLNHHFEAASLPLKVENMVSIWTILYTQPGRYNWMYQYYLRLEGLQLSWVGTGRLIMSHNFSHADFEQVMERMLKAAEAMRRDGWWWQNPALDNKAIRRGLMREMISTRFSRKPANHAPVTRPEPNRPECVTQQEQS